MSADRLTSRWPGQEFSSFPPTPAARLQISLLQKPGTAHSGTANGLNLLLLSAEQRTWPDLLLGRPGRE
jgi:hypothetical protein